MVALYIVVGIVIYALGMGIAYSLAERRMNKPVSRMAVDDCWWIAWFWPIVFPFYLMILLFRLGKHLVKQI